MGFLGGLVGWDEVVIRGFKGLFGEVKVIWELEVKVFMSRKEIVVFVIYRFWSVIVCWEIVRLGYFIFFVSEIDLFG